MVPESNAGIRRPEHEVTTHLHLVLRLRMSGATPLLPYMPSLRGQGQLYFFDWFDEIEKGSKQLFIDLCCVAYRRNWDGRLNVFDVEGGVSGPG